MTGGVPFPGFPGLPAKPFSILGGVSAERMRLKRNSPDPLRLRIQKALTTCIESVDPIYGEYTHALHGRVFRGRDRFDQDSSSPDLVPFVSILESEPQAGDQNDSNDGDGTVSMRDYRLVIQGWAEDDEQNPTDPAHLLMADVRRAIAKECLRENGHILSIDRIKRLEFLGSVVQPPALASEKCFFLLEIRLLIAEDHLQPYT